MPRVLNMRHLKGKPLPENAVYVGRPSVFGNPFVVGRDGTRERVIAAYRYHLKTNASLTVQAIRELRGKDLVCWCAPEACHADVLLDIANGGTSNE